MADPADDKRKNLILAMTPDGKIVGVKFAWKRPDIFEGDADREHWMNESFERVERVREEIQAGINTLESYGDMLDMEPEVDDEILAALRKRTQYG